MKSIKNEDARIGNDAKILALEATGKTVSQAMNMAGSNKNESQNQTLQQKVQRYIAKDDRQDVVKNNSRTKQKESKVVIMNQKTVEASHLVTKRPKDPVSRLNKPMTRIKKHTKNKTSIPIF